MKHLNTLYKALYATILAATVVALTSGCSSASSDSGLEQRVMDLEGIVAEQNRTINDLDTALSEVELALGPRVVSSKSGTNAITAEGHGGGHRIAEFAPLAFTGAGCTGDSFLPGGGFFGPTGAKQGFVFAARPNGTDTEYLMVAPATAQAEFLWASALQDGVCQDRDPTLVVNTAGYAVVRADPTVCGVPDLDIPATMWPSVGAPRGVMHLSDRMEVWTSESCLTIVPAELLPKITAGPG